MNLSEVASCIDPALEAKLPASKPCVSCNGAGKKPADNYSPERPCSFCAGTGTFDRPSARAILAECSGRNPGALRSARPKSDRAYYVWRNARFHGGVDMTLPIMARVLAHGDPYCDALDAIADVVARVVYGSDMRAAERWAGLL